MSAYQQLLGRYYQARRAWRVNPSLREMGAALGWEERHYCDRYVASEGPIYDTDTGHGLPFIPDDYTRAFLEAGRCLDGEGDEEPDGGW